MKFIDTNIFIANLFRDETNHEKAKKIIQKIDSETAIYSDYILDEILAWIRSKKGAKISIDVMDNIIESKLRLFKIEEKHIVSATEIFRKYERLSFTDCTIIALMQDKGIKDLYSFDSGFDGVSSIVRSEE